MRRCIICVVSLAEKLLLKKKKAIVSCEKKLMTYLNVSVVENINVYYCDKWILPVTAQKLFVLRVV